MKAVHLINPMRNPAGGSEHRTIGLFEALSDEASVQIWTEEEPNPAFLGRVPMTKIGPSARFPRGGTVVFVGTYFSIGGWITAAQPERVVLVHNMDQADRLRQVVRSLSSIGLRRLEVVYSSPSIQSRTPEIPGVCEESPIDIETFSPAPRSERPFTVGRLSRDLPDKFHPNDAGLFRRLADAGVHLRILGGTTLGLSHPGIDIYPENSVPAASFLQSLDCFIYRTHPALYEAYGRVIFEAMACGLPIVAESRHGYSPWLKDGENALLADSDEALYEAVGKVRNDPDLRRGLGERARQTAEKVYGGDYRRRLHEFYLR